MRNCPFCNAEEHPAAPFVEGVCDRCRAAPSFARQLKNIPNGVGLVVLSGFIETAAAAAVLIGIHFVGIKATQDAGLLVFFVGCVLSIVAAIAFMLGILRWSLGPFVEIVVRQNDHLIGLVKASKK